MTYEGNTIYETIAELSQEVTYSISAQDYELNDDAGMTGDITETIIDKALELEELLAEADTPQERDLYDELIEMTAHSVIAQLLITGAIRKAKIECCVAGPSVTGETPLEAIDCWNTRAPQWQPIETAPTHQTVFIYAQTWGEPVLAKRLRDEWMVHVVSRVHRINLFEPFEYVPTHWMPLPVPPVESEADSND